MKKNIKQIISMILSLTFIMSCIVIPEVAYAYDASSTALSSNRANISYVYIGKTDSSSFNGNYFDVFPGDGATGPTLDAKKNITDTFVAGDYVWVGLQVSNISVIKEELFKASNAGNSDGEGGLSSATFSYWYDKRYLEPVTSDNPFYYVQNNYPSTSGRTGITYLYQLSQAAADPTICANPDAKEAVKLDEDNTQTFFVDIVENSSNNNSSNRMFMDTESKTWGNESVILMVFPFKVLEVPETGKNVLQGALSNDRLVLSEGHGDDANTGYQWHQDRNNDASTNLKNYFNVTNADGTEPSDGIVDIFPKSYSVSFYDKYESGTYGNQILSTGATGITEGTAIADAGITEPTVGATGADLTSPRATDGKYFAGWKYLPYGGSATDYSSLTTIGSAAAADDGGSEIKVYATWADPYKVRFHSNYNGDHKDGGTDVTPLEVNVAPDGSSKVTAPDTSSWTKSGYVITGWEKSDGSAFDIANDNITGDLDLYAVWEQKYTIKYDSNGGTGTITDSTGKPADSYTVPSSGFTREHYDLAGLNTKADGSGTTFTLGDSSKTYQDIVDQAKTDGVTVSNGEVTLYAVWTPKSGEAKYTVTFDPVGGSVTPTSVEVAQAEAKINVLPTPTKTDYKFDGWYTDADPQVASTAVTEPYTATDDTTLYAHWTYTGSDYITLMFDTGNDDTAQYSYEIGKGDSLGFVPAPGTKKGFAFDKWTYGGSNEFTKDTQFTDDTTITGQWKQKVSVTFDANGLPTTVATMPLKIENLTPGTDKYTIPDLTVTDSNYEFKGWNTKGDGSGTAYTTLPANDQVAPATDLTLYAIWEYKGADAITVTFDKNDSTTKPASFVTGITDPYTIKAKPNTTIAPSQMPTPTRNSYTFSNWAVSKTATASTPQTAITVSDTSGTNAKTMSVYAIWNIDGDSVTVSFNTNGATTPASISPITIAKGDSLGSLMPADPERTGYGFDGWMENSESAYNSASAFTNATAVTSDITVKAFWTEQIKIEYDANGGTGAPEAVKDAPSATYSDPVTTGMALTGSNGNYEFAGWNTAANGSGVTIDAATYKTYKAVADATKANPGDATPSTVKLYAQWTAAKMPAGTDPDPTTKGIKVTFDSNATTQYPAQKDANPNVKFPQLGDTMDKAVKMPADPERASYVFASWNTKPDGTGKTVDKDTVLNATNLGDALKTVTGETNAYELTLYAQWTPGSGETTVTLNFYDHKTAAGGAIHKTYTIVSGDSLGFDVDAPTWDGRTAKGWFTGSGNPVALTTTEFDKTAAVSASTNYYEKWERPLIAIVNEGKDSNSVTYNGENIKPTIKIYDAELVGSTWEKKSGATVLYEYTSGTDSGKDSTFTTNFDLSYADADTKATVTDTKAVGKYNVIAQVKAAVDLATVEGADVKNVMNNPVEVQEAAADILVDPTTQKFDYTGSAATKATITVDSTTLKTGDSALTIDDIADIKYYKWTDDSGADGNIQESELTEVTGTLQDIGFYVIKLTAKSGSNYKIGNIKSSTTDALIAYPAAKNTDYPGYTPGANDKVVFYQIKPNDPSLDALSAVANDGATDTNVSFKANDYKTAKAYTADDSASGAEENKYYSVVDKDTTKIKVTYKPKYAVTTAEVKLGGGSAITATANGDGSYTAEVTLAATDKDDYSSDYYKPQVITVKTTAGTGASAVTKTYTVTIQRDASRIELNPGNSPYGLIERMAKDVTPWNATKIKEAKEAFDNSNSINKTYGTGYVPTNGETTVKYTTTAWGAGKNYDMDEAALFVFEADKFVDPGIVIYDQAGVIVKTPSVDKVLKLRRISNGVPTYETSEGTEVSINEKTIDGTQKFDLSGVVYRPDVYNIDYEYKYNDVNDNSSKSLKISRPLILLSKRGDVTLTSSPVVNSNDATALKNNWSKINGRSKLFAFRVADVQITSSPVINSNDATDLKNNWSKGYKAFYKNVD